MIPFKFILITLDRSVINLHITYEETEETLTDTHKTDCKALTKTRSIQIQIQGSFINSQSRDFL